MKAVAHITKNKVRITKQGVNWQLRLKNQGRDYYFQLPAKREAASARAEAIKALTKADGIEKALELYHKGTRASLLPPEPKRSVQTVGTLIKVYRERAGALDLEPSTLKAYTGAFRRLLKGAGVEHPDSFKVDSLSSNVIDEYRSQLLSSTDEGERDQARTTGNATIRNAKALLSDRFLRMCPSLNTPAVKSFKKGELFAKAPQISIKSPPLKEVRRLFDNLDVFSEEERKIIFLALFGGLRKQEINFAKPDWFELEGDPRIRVAPSECFRPKGKVGYGGIRLDIAQWILTRSGERLLVDQKLIPAVVAKMKRIKLLPYTRKPLQGLRELYGCYHACRKGLFHAQKNLRHAKSTTTSDYYATITLPEEILQIWEAYQP